MTNFFSSDVFLQAMGNSIPGRGQYEIIYAEVENHTFRMIRKGGSIRTALPFIDFWEPVSAVSPPPEKLSHLPRVCINSIPAREWVSAQNHIGYPAPWTDWHKFATWDDFQSFARQNSSKAFHKKNAPYRIRRLEKDVGPMTIDFDSDDKKMLELCMDWKSKQYRASDYEDVLAANTIGRRLFTQLFDAGHLKMAVLKAGNIPLAIHMGAVWDGRFYYWIPAYDSSYAIHSAGNILMEKLIEWSFAEKHQSFDFLSGNESYKYYYATDVRIIQPLGPIPLAHQLWERVSPVIKSQLQRYPRLLSTLQTLKREVVKRINR